MEGKKLGIIDLGSNSIRFVMYQIENTGSYKETLNLKKTARLSIHVDEHKNITTKGMDVIIDTMRNFRELVEYHQVEEVHCIATAVIRDAPNRNVVLQQIKEETDLNFQVLSGHEEGFYGYLAVVNSTNIKDGVTIDIGGGSTEVTLFRNRQLCYVHSFPFGAITLTREFINNEQPTEEELERLRHFLSEQFNSIPWLKSSSLPVIGIGGSARNLALIHQRLKKYPLPSIHQYEIDGNDIQKINKYLMSFSLRERKKIDGLSKDRADIIIPAIEVISQLIKVVQSPLFIMSSKGIRDGLFYQKILDEFQLKMYPNVLEESFFQLRNKYGMKSSHAEQIVKICTDLFGALDQKHLVSLDENDLTLLLSSAQINYIGEHISLDSKSEHTFYIVKNSLIEGVRHFQRIQIALIASFKSRHCMKQYLQTYKDWFTEEQMKKVELFGALLKIAYGLERTKRNLVEKISLVPTDNDMIIFRVVHRQDNRFEREYVEHHKKHLEKVLKTNVFFQYEQVK